MAGNNTTTTTTTTTTTSTDGIPQSNLIQAIYLIIVIVVAVLGNTLVIVVIIRKRLLENVTNCFILNLAISDLLNASLKMTTTVAGLFDRNWYPSNIICYFTTPFGVLFGAASVLSLTSVAVTRYLVVSSPFVYAAKITTRVASVVLGCVWLASVLLSFPPTTWRPFKVICKSGAVSEEYYNSELIYVVALWLFVIVLPSLVMMTSYFLMYRVTTAQIRRIKETNTVSKSKSQTAGRRREMRAALVLGVIGGIFILCWFPFFVILTLYKFAKTRMDPLYFKVFLSWMYTNSAINPVLLVAFNNEIKSAVRRMLGRRRRIYPTSN